MSLYRVHNDDPWDLSEMMLAIRSLFDMQRHYANEVEGQYDVEFRVDTIYGMAQAGYDLADRAYMAASEVRMKEIYAERAAREAEDDSSSEPNNTQE